MDGPKAQTQGKFRRKCREFDIDVKQLKAYNSKSNTAEGGVQDLKRGTGVNSSDPTSQRHFWITALGENRMVDPTLRLKSSALKGKFLKPKCSGIRRTSQLLRNMHVMSLCNIVMSPLGFLIPRYNLAKILDLRLILGPPWILLSLRRMTRSHTRQMCDL
jgi:hypothetical protein